MRVRKVVSIYPRKDSPPSDEWMRKKQIGPMRRTDIRVVKKSTL
jgi:hypothetical protein